MLCVLTNGDETFKSTPHRSQVLLPMGLVFGGDFTMCLSASPTFTRSRVWELTLGLQSRACPSSQSLRSHLVLARDCRREPLTVLGSPVPQVWPTQATVWKQGQKLVKLSVINQALAICG